MLVLLLELEREDDLDLLSSLLSAMSRDPTRTAVRRPAIIEAVWIARPQSRWRMWPGADDDGDDGDDGDNASVGVRTSNKPGKPTYFVSDDSVELALGERLRQPSRHRDDASARPRSGGEGVRLWGG